MRGNVSGIISNDTRPERVNLWNLKCGGFYATETVPARSMSKCYKSVSVKGLKWMAGGENGKTFQLWMSVHELPHLKPEPVKERMT